ncbi:hypothetical protein JCM10449v2_008086 [Rhodotorula kratochvilovae]
MSRVKLDNLPTEIKKRIVELCAEQDERFQERLTAIERMGGAELALDQIRARHGRSVGTLFCLSRSWSEIAASYRFKVRPSSPSPPRAPVKVPAQVLKLSQTEDITFKVWVSHKRLAFFTTLIIDKATAPAYEAFLPILGGLPNVRTLILHQPFFDRILAAQPIAQRSIDGGPHLTPLGCVCIGELRKTIQRVERLDIQLENYPLSRSIAGKTSSTLKTLRFNLKCVAGKSNKLLAFLALFPSLQTLEIDCDTATSDDVDVFQGSPQALPALARLVIERPSSNKHAARLAAVFAGSLRSLRIQSHEHRFPGYISLDVVFPLVQRLELAGEWFSVSPFYSFATPRTFPGLRVIELAADHMIGIGDKSSLLPVLEAFTALPTHPLSQVVLRNSSRVTCAEERAYVERWNADIPRVRIDLGVDLLPAPNTLHGDAFDETSDVDDFEAGRSEVATTLDFLIDWHQRIRAGGPTEREEYTRLAEILEVAEFERFALQA